LAVGPEMEKVSSVGEFDAGCGNGEGACVMLVEECTRQWDEQVVTG